MAGGWGYLSVSRDGLMDGLRRAGGPYLGFVAGKDGHFGFRPVDDPAEASMSYLTWQSVSAARNAVHPPQEVLMHFDLADGSVHGADEPEPPGTLLFIRPCDVHALMRLDVVLNREPADSRYRKRRSEAVVVCLECHEPGEFCFCRSFGTGPGFLPDTGCDLVLSPLGEDFVARPLTERGFRLLPAEAAEAPKRLLGQKAEAEERAVHSFIKEFNTADIPAILASDLEHPVYEREANRRCLNCGNCTLVCPTCFCYEVDDRVEPDGSEAKRFRRWDVCQDYSFAQVHGGNFRSSRKARLRQFVTHKLCNWLEQFGTLGCIGCGRCMRWCPTGIDLTVMADEVRASHDG